MTTTPATQATPKRRADLCPSPQAWQAVLVELRKDPDRRAQLTKALLTVYRLTDRLLTDHAPCHSSGCATCTYIKEALTVFYALDALWANDFNEKGGAT